MSRPKAVSETTQKMKTSLGARKREGTPKIVRAPISNGLLELTGQAVYSTSGSLEFGFPKRHFMTPKDGRKYFAFGFRLYSLEGGSAEILCTSTTSAFSAKFSQSTNEAFLCQIYDCGRKPRRFEIPMASLPTDVMLYARKDGGFAVLATSLADGGVRKAFGDATLTRCDYDADELVVVQTNIRGERLFERHIKAVVV